MLFREGASGVVRLSDALKLALDTLAAITSEALTWFEPHRTSVREQQDFQRLVGRPSSPTTTTNAPTASVESATPRTSRGSPRGALLKAHPKPSPWICSPSTTISPRLIPIRNSTRRATGNSALLTARPLLDLERTLHALHGTRKLCRQTIPSRADRAERPERKYRLCRRLLEPCVFEVR